MSEPSSPPPAATEKTFAPPPREKPAGKPPSQVFLVSYPKIIFLYPIFLLSIVAATTAHFTERGSATDVTLATIFLGMLAVNLVILAFDFPRTTSLTLFFFAAAVVIGLILLFKLQPDLLPFITDILHRFQPSANPTFYWTFTLILGGIFVIVFIVARFDYWEVRPNELLHHHGFLSNLERLSAPNLRIDKEINDIFEYLLLHSGRLILQASSERRAIVLDNVPWIKQKEEAITRMLGALQVQVRSDSAEH